MQRYGSVGKEPTKRQMDVVNAIEHLWGELGVAPTLRELCEYLGIGSTNAVADLVKSLERRNMVARGPAGTARSLMTTRMSVNIKVGEWPWDKGSNE